MLQDALLNSAYHSKLFSHPGAMAKFLTALIAISASSISAHALPHHEHLAARQVNAPAVPNAGAVAVPSTGSLPVAGSVAVALPAAGSLPSSGGLTTAVPGTGSLPSTGGLTGAIPGTGSLPAVSGLAGSISPIAGSIDSCLGAIPQELISMIQAVENRLSNVQSQIAGVAQAVSGLPVSTPTLPVVPTLSTSVPGVPSLPAALPTGLPSGLPSVSTGLPTLPSLPAAVPSLSAGLPSVSSLPAVLPSLSAAVPTFPSLPAALPSLPAALPSLPAGVPTLPSVPAGLASAPAALPSLPGGLPSIPAGLPAASVPAALPTVSRPAVPSLPAALPSLPAALPSLPAALPSLPAAVPNVSVSTPVGGVSVPGLSAPLQTGPGGILVSTNPTLCPPKNGLGPMVPCASQAVNLQSSTSDRILTSALVNPRPTGPGLPVTQLSLPAVLTLTTMTDVVMSPRPVSSPTSSPRTFNANARDNVAAYYGSTAATSPTGLGTLCQTNVDIIILSFLYDFFSANGYPSIDFGPACNGRTTAQASSAPGLKNCTSLASQIQTCQSLGVKVLLSLGGYVANSTFTSDLEARNFAVTLWNLFGAGNGVANLRPFGSNVVIDGFDLDNEDGSTAHWNAFASAMRALFNSDQSKTYYLSAAPQCPYPDASIPIYALQHADFVWVQFYNNPSCNLDSLGFQSSVATWSQALTNSSLPTSPKLFIGAPAFPGAGSGYVEGQALPSRISLAENVSLGGIMLWDGTMAMQEDQSGHTYLQYAKSAMQRI